MTATSSDTGDWERRVDALWAALDTYEDPAEFRAFVDRMARTKLRWADRGHDG